MLMYTKFGSAFPVASHVEINMPKLTHKLFMCMNMA
jgi:hypothetical protein